MFKESPVEKLIDYIKTLPAEEQKLIVKKISTKKKGSKTKVAKAPGKKIQAFIEYTQNLPARLPKNYKFDREEANER